MGLMSGMFHLLYVNLVLFFVRPYPLDPDDALFKVHRGHQSVAVGQDIKNNPGRCKDAGPCVVSLDVVCILPLCLLHFSEPRIGLGGTGLGGIDETYPKEIAPAAKGKLPGITPTWRTRARASGNPGSRPMTKTRTPYVRLGSRMVRPFTCEKWRRLNVARVLPRCNAVAATIRS
jgi:hypothetical protein